MGAIHCHPASTQPITMNPNPLPPTGPLQVEILLSNTIKTLSTYNLLEIEEPNISKWFSIINNMW